VTAVWRSGRIDTLRGVSILLVLLHHFNIAYPLKGTPLATLLGWRAVHAVARNGNYGVTMFFAVSGFLITGNALRRWGRLERIQLAEFYLRRAARILPCLLLALLVVDALAMAGVRIFDNRPDAGVSLWVVNFAALTFWMNVLVVQHGWINYPLGVLWSLSVEVVFYALFPLACLWLRRRWALTTLVLVAVCCGPLYRYANQQGGQDVFLYAYPACFDAIVIGCCAAVLARRKSFPALQRRTVRLVIGAAMAALYLAWPIGESNIAGVTAMALGTALLLLGVGEAGRDSPSRRFVPVWALELCGRRSYEIYLFHLVVLGLMRTLVPPNATTGAEKIVLLALYLALSAVVGAGVARLWSDPANAAIRRRFYHAGA
jgi:peptidoglycan/LPS O-acetylase OafA/YrhL